MPSPDTWPVWLTVALLFLAVDRVTVLIVDDAITEPVRARIGAVENPRPARRWLITLIGCPWCVSVWACFAAIPAAVWCWPVTGWVCLGLAASTVAGSAAAVRERVSR